LVSLTNKKNQWKLIGINTNHRRRRKMATPITIKHEQSGMMKKGYYGFSWTYLFWGWLVPIIRGEMGIGALHLLFTICTVGFWQLIMCFLYNKQYMTRMFTTGWTLSGGEAEIKQAKMELGIAF
jgi:hypothetical protein